MTLDLIIDGYNLLHFAGLARVTYGPGDLQRVRQRLLVRLANGLTAEEIPRTTIVFDARDVPAGERRQENFRGLRVLYSPPGKEADDVIEDLVARHSAPKQLAVISSDNRLVRAIRSRKGISIDSDSFLGELERRQPVVAESHMVEQTPEETPSDAEVEHWMQAFGVDEERIDPEFPSTGPQSIDPPLDHVTQFTRPQEGEPDSGAAQPSLLDELEAELRRCLEDEDLT